MEKRRRARINNSLSELKNLILDTLAKDNARHSKLEKADILEMTVKHLQQLQRQHQRHSVISDATVGKFRAGYSECASEVGRYLGREALDPSLGQRLLSHLANCVSSFGPDRRPYEVHRQDRRDAREPVHVQVPGDGPSGNLELVATRLTTGELVFYVPTGHRQESNSGAPIDVLGSSGILSPAASDRSNSPPCRSMTDGRTKVEPEPHRESVWRPW